MEEIRQNTAGEAVMPPPATGRSSEDALSQFGTAVLVDQLRWRSQDLIMEASLEVEQMEGQAVLRRVYLYLENGTLENAGSSTAQFDPEAPVEATEPGVLGGPRSGDLFTFDYSTFYGVRDTKDLAPSREDLLIHVPPGGDWKTAVWGFIQECDRSIQVWDANGIPTPIGPAD